MSPSRAEMFAAWAPSDSRWSVWAKPVLFAQAPLSPPGREPELPEVNGLMRLKNAAVIIDVKGTESVMLGLALAQIGFQPVPLYNSAASMGQLVQMDDIADMLSWGPVFLPRAKRRPDAPPVFLMNADRFDHPVGAQVPGRFDNRWALVPQDMPSAGFLKSAGITKVVLVADDVRSDIAHVLYSYQQAQIALERTPKAHTFPAALNVNRPSAFRSMWYRIGVFAGLRRNSAGGFGAIIPDPQAMSGGGGWG